MSFPGRRTTSGQSSESVVSSRQLVAPLSVWQLTVTCLIFASRKPNRARHKSRIPFFLGSSLGNLVIVVPGGGARTSSLPSVFFSSAFGAASFFLSSALGAGSFFFSSALGAASFFACSLGPASDFLVSSFLGSGFEAALSFVVSGLGVA